MEGRAMQTIANVIIEAGDETPDSVADELFEIISDNLPIGWTLLTVSARPQQ